MKSYFIFNTILLALLLLFTLSPAQNNQGSSVIIKDQNGNTAPVIKCDYNFTQDHCLTLTAEYPEIKNATDYAVSPITYSPIGNFTEGTEITISSDDKWSNVIPLNFAFCLYGMSFTSMVVSDNGMISFDPQLTGTTSPSAIAGNITSGKLSSYTIFGLYHDMTNDPASSGCSTGNCGKITQYTTGTAPFRKTVINYYNMNLYDCKDKRSTFQIVLYETTNVIEVYVKEKPTSCKDPSPASNVNKTLCGITNQTGIGVAAPGVNNEPWTTANGSAAWQFNPKGKDITEVKWFDPDNNLIGTGKTITVCPGNDITYKAQVNYNSCAPSNIFGTISIKFAYEYPVAQSVGKELCYQGTPPQTFDFTPLIPEAVNLSAGYKTALYNTREDAIAGNTNTVPGTNSTQQTLYLRVESPINKNCFTIVTLTITPKLSPNSINDTTIDICLPPNTTRTINFATDNILNLSSALDARFYLNKSDADNNNTNFMTTFNVPAPVSTSILYARVFNKTSKTCPAKVIKVTINAKLKINLPDLIYDQICDNYTIPNFNLTQYVQQNIPGNYEFLFYLSESDALAGNNNHLTASQAASYTVSTYNIFYVRVAGYKDGYCPPVFKLSFLPKRSLINFSNISICGDGTQIINLDNYFNTAKGSINATLKDFYANPDGTGVLPRNLPVNESRVIYADYEEGGCSYIKPVIILFIQRVDKPSTFNVCDTQQDGLGKEDFLLSNLNYIFLTGFPRTPYLYYYASLQDLENSKPPITHILVTQNTSPDVYVRVIDPVVRCYFVYKITLKLSQYTLPETHNQTIQICDNNLDNKEIINLNNYTSSLITLSDTDNINNYTFTFYSSFDSAVNNLTPISLTSTYVLQNFIDSPVTIYVKIRQNNGTCFNIVELKFENSNFIQANNTSVYKCDELNDGYELFDLLKDYNPIQKMISDTSGLTITYHDTEENANKYSYTTALKDPTKGPIAFNNSKTTIWVRFENALTKCYTVRYIEVNLVPPLKGNTISYSLCDTDFDGIYTLNLEDLKSQIKIDHPELYHFSYYRNPDGTGEITGNEINNYVVAGLAPGNNRYVYIKVSLDNCSTLFTFVLSTTNKAPTKTEIPELKKCDDNFDGIITFTQSELIAKAQEMIPSADLSNPANTIQYTFYHTREEAEKGNPTSGNFTNIKPYNDQVFVRINSSKYCPNIGVMNLTVLPLPVSPLQPELKICTGENLTLNAETGNSSDTYTWSTGATGYIPNITIQSPGKYWVTITSTNGCSYTYHTEVTEYPKITINQIMEGTDYITVKAEGPATLEYSLNGTDWQSSNTFEKLTPGTYTIYVRSTSIPCKPVTAKGIIFDFKNTFTPNSDGINDTWTLCGLDVFNGKYSHIKIFDRYGKIVFEETSNTCFNWNGRYLGRPLPTSSYWYVITIADGREFTGWILLRNYKDGIN